MVRVRVRVGLGLGLGLGFGLGLGLGLEWVDALSRFDKKKGTIKTQKKTA